MFRLHGLDVFFTRNVFSSFFPEFLGKRTSLSPFCPHFDKLMIQQRNSPLCILSITFRLGVLHGPEL
ncbi:MAG: hypothetical protein ACKPKO_23655, partial [Candidatus Fonsibacter sp.]